MRKSWKAAAAAVVIAAAFAAPASAQMGFSIAGGPSFGLGTLGDAYDAGYHLQGSAALSLPLIPIGVRVDGLFNQFPGDAASFRTLAGTVNGVISIPSVGITPYIIGGVGMYSNKVDVKSGEDFSSTDFGVNIGGGVRMALPGLGVFVEGRLHNVFSEGSSTRFIPLSIGVRF